MTTLREAAQQALDALEVATTPRSEDRQTVLKAQAALREALAKPDPEPVAWMVYTLDGKSAFVTDNPTGFGPEHKALPLYTTPPQRKPLTDEEISLITASVPLKLSSEFVLNIARAIERAHGIGEKE